MDNENYEIKITGGGKERRINLSPGLFKFGAVSLALAGIIFVGSCGYSVYSAMHKQKNIEIVNEVEKAGEIRQEQILNLSKKAGELNETLQNLSQRENELRIQAGLNPPKEDKPAENPAPPESENPPEENSGGQGGPVGELSVEDVSEALSMIEERTKTRIASLDDFQTQIKARRDTLAAGAFISGTYSGEFDISKFRGTPSADSHYPSIWPVNGVVTSPYGLRWGGTDFHPGIDIANDMGTPIIATADGIVEYAGWNSGGYGNMVDINHGNGIMTRYGHASQVVVATGQAVKRGQLIAYMGSTGFSTGPHVHYEVHINGQRVNPVSYL